MEEPKDKRPPFLVYGTQNKTVNESDLVKAFFDVRKETLFTRSDKPTNRKAIIRDDTGDVLGICSNDYELVKNKELFTKTKEALGKVGNFEVVKLWIEKRGARTYIEFDAKTDKYVIAGPQDEVRPRLVLFNSYDLKRPCGFIAGIFRLVCSNGMYVGVKQFEYSKKHIKGLDLNELINHSQDIMKVIDSELLPRYREMAYTQINYKRYRKIKKIMPKRLFKDIDNPMNRLLNKTEWEGYNDFTAYLTHEYRRSFTAQLNLNEKLARAFEILEIGRQRLI